MWSIVISSPNVFLTNVWMSAALASLPNFFTACRTASILVSLAWPALLPLPLVSAIGTSRCGTNDPLLNLTPAPPDVQEKETFTGQTGRYWSGTSCPWRQGKEIATLPAQPTSADSISREGPAVKPPLPCGASRPGSRSQDVPWRGGHRPD